MKRIDDKKVYEYLQGHWIVEMSEMNAVANAKSIEETKSFLSRQKDIYRIPYERRAEDRYRQCVFCGTSNDLNFLLLTAPGTGDLLRSGYFRKKRKPPFMKMKQNPERILSRHGQRQWRSTEAEIIR